jgi:hypothetical protein
MVSQSSSDNPASQPESNEAKEPVSHQIENDEKLVLLNRVGELEARIPQEEAEQVSSMNLKGDIKKKTPHIFLFSLTIIIAAIPALLIVKYKWLEYPFQSEILDRWWREIGLGLVTPYRSYFLIIILCILATIILVTTTREGPLIFFSERINLKDDSPETVNAPQKRLGKVLLGLGSISIAGIFLWTFLGKHIPGWDLLLAQFLYIAGWFFCDISFDSIKGYWREKGLPLMVMIFSTFSLIAFFASLYSKEGLWWIFSILLFMAFLFLFQFRDQIPTAYWVINIALVSFTLFVNAWWFTAVGDEYSFYNYAVELATRQPIAIIGERLFNGQGVFGTHPQISTLIQVVFMKFLGTHNFGWRFSNVFLSAVAIGFFYSFFKIYIPQRIALITALFLAASEYLMTFGKIGYNNLQAFFTLGLILWTVSYAIQSRRFSAYALLGLSMGFCFYVYPAALYTLILPLILLMMYDPPISKNALMHWGVLAISSLALIFPLFFQPSYWSIKEAGTFLYNPEITRSAQSLFGHLGKNILYSFLSFLYIPEESHFLAVSYMDPISGTLLLIGFAYAIKNVVKTRLSLFWMLSFALMVFLVGASHDRAFPPTTRMFLLLPWFAFFAATGLVWIQYQATQLSQAKVTGVIIPVVIFSIFVTNFYQAYTFSPTRMEQYQGIEALFLRTARRGEEIEPNLTKRYIFITQPNWGIDGLLMIQKVYQTPTSPLQIGRIMITDEDLARGMASGKASGIISENRMPLLTDKDSIVFLQRYTSTDWVNKVEAALVELGMTSCDVRNFRGRIVFKIWHHGMYNSICE